MTRDLIDRLMRGQALTVAELTTLAAERHAALLAKLLAAAEGRVRI